MPTLADFHGSSLVGNIDRSIGDIRAFGQQLREEEQLQEQENLAIQAAGLTPKPAKISPAMSFINEISPDLGAFIGELTGARSDPNEETLQQVEAFRTEAKADLDVANRILAESSPVKKQAILREEAQRISSQGGEISDIIRLSNLSPAELDLQAQKVQLTSEAALRATPKPTNNEREIARIKLNVRNPQAAASLREGRAEQRGIVEAERVAALPQTAAGQTSAAIAADVASGAITQGQADQLTAQLQQTLEPQARTERGQQTQAIAADVASGALTSQAGAAELQKINRVQAQTQIGALDQAVDEDIASGAISPEIGAQLKASALRAATATGVVFEPVLDDAGNVIAQRNTATGELVDAPDAMTAAANSGGIPDFLSGAQKGAYAAAVSEGATPQEALITATRPSAVTTDFAKIETASNALVGLFDDYQRLIDDVGGQFLPGTTEKQQVATARRGIQLQLKELLNLGVLNGPDLELMDAMLADTGLGFFNWTPFLGTNSERTRASIEGVKNMMSKVVASKRAGVTGSEIEPAQRENKTKFDEIPSGTIIIGPTGGRFRKP